MIQGFSVDVTAEELVTHLDERVRHRERREECEECEAKLRQLQVLEPGPHDEEEVFDMRGVAAARLRAHGCAASKS